MYDQLKRLERANLETLAQKRPFKILNVSRRWITIRTSVGNVRCISVEEIQSAWNQLKKDKVLTRKEIRLKHSEFNPAYVASILSSFSSVHYDLHPIT